MFLVHHGKLFEKQPKNDFSFHSNEGKGFISSSIYDKVICIEDTYCKKSHSGRLVNHTRHIAPGERIFSEYEVFFS